MPEPAIGLRLEVALEPDADAAKLEHATSYFREDQRRLVESFLARHSP